MSSSARSLIIGAMLLALAQVIPTIFHALNLGSSFLPMFYPILAAGFLTEFPVALAVGFLSPLLSSFLTGMPPLFPPIAFIMMAEGLFLGGLPVLLNQRKKIKIWPTLLLTLLADRAVLLVAVLITAKWLSLPEKVLGLASVLHGLPGIIILLIIFPPLVKKLQKKLLLFPLDE
ncbi:MAG: ECF transporter S component [Candidatus Aminicenantales bacterium]